MQAAMHVWWGHVLFPTGTKALWWWGGEVPVGLNMSLNTKGAGTASPRSGVGISTESSVGPRAGH
jgi:hypothetical protein